MRCLASLIMAFQPQRKTAPAAGFDRRFSFLLPALHRFRVHSRCDRPIFRGKGLAKNENPSFIHKTLVDVTHGGALMSPSIALKTIRFLTERPPQKKIVQEHEGKKLTDREIEILRLIAKGFTYQTIADQLTISVQTIKKHMSNIFEKLQVNNKIEALNKSKELL